MTLFGLNIDFLLSIVLLKIEVSQILISQACVKSFEIEF